MIPSFNLDETSKFFVDLFEFTIVKDGDYMILNKDDIFIHILRAGEVGEIEFYYVINGLDQLWEKIKGNLEGIKVKPPFNQDYGMREFHVIVPHTKVLMFVAEEMN